MHSVTDRQTEGQKDDASSQSYCVAVQSSNKTKYHQTVITFYNLTVVKGK